MAKIKDCCLCASESYLAVVMKIKGDGLNDARETFLYAVRTKL